MIQTIENLLRSVLLAVFASTLFLISVAANASPWNLPAALTPKNTTISFELDSTWHTVHGAVPKLFGELSLEDPEDPTSVIGKITIPVHSLDTDNSSRDEEMREVMDAEEFPNVIFKVTKLTPSCEAEFYGETAPTKTTECPYEALGTVTIRNVSKQLPITGKVIRSGDTYTISGKTKLFWEEFGVEDPSIFIARVDKEVVVSFSMTLPPVKNSPEKDAPSGKES